MCHTFSKLCVCKCMCTCVVVFLWSLLTSHATLKIKDETNLLVQAIHFVGYGIPNVYTISMYTGWSLDFETN